MRLRMPAVLALALIPALAAPAAAEWCLDSDVVRVEADAAEVRITHEGAWYNCCPDPIAYAVDFAGGVLTVVESEGFDAPCYCLCCFELTVTIEDVPPGDWTLDFRWYDHESLAWASSVLPFTVPDAGQGGEAGLAGAERSNCLTAAGVDGAVPDGIDWGRLKTYYR